jgi:hypothetical protein
MPGWDFFLEVLYRFQPSAPNTHLPKILVQNHNAALAFQQIQFHHSSEKVFQSLAIRNRGYTDKTHLRGFQIPRVRVGGLRLCSRDF